MENRRLATQSGKKIKKKSKVHSNSFVLSNISLLKKTNAELAKKLSACQMESLMIQQDQHSTWKRNVKLTLELKECKKRLLDAEKELQEKNELLNKLQNGVKSLMYMCNFDNKTEITVQQITPTTEASANVNKKEVHEAKNIIKDKSVMSLYSACRVKTKPSKNIKHDLNSVEEDNSESDISKSFSLSPQSDPNDTCDNNTEEDNNFKIIAQTDNKEKCETNNMNSSMLDTTANTIHMLPGRNRKAKRSKKSIRWDDESFRWDDKENESSCINIEETVVVEENLPSDVYGINEEKCTPPPKTKNGLLDESPSPLQLYLDLEETILGQVEVALSQSPNTILQDITNTDIQCKIKDGKRSKDIFSPCFALNEDLSITDSQNDSMEKITNDTKRQSRKKRIKSSESSLNENETVTRPRRSRKNITYTEPSLMKKMRRPT